jgi:succinoglycan biosynthesis transport protein ExoP
LNDLNPQNTASGQFFGDMQLRDYLQILQRRKWWIIFATIGIFSATLVVAMRMPNIYESETLILVDPQKVPDNYVPTTNSSSIYDRLSTIRQQVMSPTRLKRIIESLGLYRELRGRLGDQEIVSMMQKATSIDVVTPGGQQVGAFRIAFHGRNPTEVAKVATELAGMFIEENLKVREQQSHGTAEFLDSELQDTKRKLEQVEDQLTAMKSRYVSDLPESKQYHLEALNSLRNQLRASQDRSNRAQQEKVYLQSLLISTSPTLDLDATGPGVSPLQSQMQKIESRLSELQSRYGLNYPDVRKLRNQLDELKAKAPAEQPNPALGEDSIKSLRRAARNPVIEAQLQKLDQEIKDEAKAQAQLEPDISLHLSKLERVPVFEQQIAGLMRDYDTLRSHYAALLDKKLSAEMAGALESRQKGERFVILDPAQVPARPYSPNRFLIGLAGLMGGLLAGIGLATITEVTDESVRNEREAASIVGWPVLAGIPQIISKSARRSKQVQIVFALAGTVAGSAALGLVISYLSARLF